jgi:acetyltransferase-like isoleucine patch superfamily enzyme
MLKILSLVFGDWVFKPYSLLIKFILISKGIRIGSNFYIQGTPILKLRGPSSNVVIGNNVSIYGNIDIRNRENGTIIVEDDVRFDTDCRLVAANHSKLIFKNGSRVGCYNIFNCGSDVSIGSNTLIAGFCYVQSSNHGLRKDEIIKKQKHTYGVIHIGNDCWIGSHVIITAGVTLKEGSVVGANAVVTKDLDSYSINVGVPAMKISERD